MDNTIKSSKIDKIKQTYLDYANFVISNNYWFRYTDIAADLGISIDELCKALGITCEIIHNGIYYYKFDSTFDNDNYNKPIRVESKYGIEYLGIEIYGEYSNGYWCKFKYDENSNKIYEEDSNDWRSKIEYDDRGNIIYQEYSSGYWVKIEYDDNSNKIYEEHSDGDWYKFKYDENSNRIYRENSDGKWSKWEYDENGNKIYQEDSDGNIKQVND